MRGVYTASAKISGLSAAKTLLYLTAPSNRVVELLSASVTNGNNMTSQQLECSLHRIATLGTPTATAVTPAPAEAGSPASSSTVAANVTASEPTYTSETDIAHREGWNSLGGWQYAPLPEERVTIPPSASIGLRMLSTPTSFDCDILLKYREIG